MKKTILTFLIALFIAMPVSALTLQGGIEYTVDSARIEAFNNIEKTISIDSFSHDLTDFLQYSNIENIKNGIFKLNAGYSRRLLPFYNNNGKLVAYGVCYDNNPERVLYYSTLGKLIKMEYNPNPDTYPHKNIAYDPKGRLYTVSLYVAPGELYNFDKNGDLIVHWIGNVAYNKNGKKLNITRRL